MSLLHVIFPGGDSGRCEPSNAPGFFFFSGPDRGNAPLTGSPDWGDEQGSARAILVSRQGGGQPNLGGGDAIGSLEFVNMVFSSRGSKLAVDGIPAPRFFFKSVAGNVTPVN